MPNCNWWLWRFHLDTVAGPQGFNPRALAASWCLGWWDQGRSADKNASTINQQFSSSASPTASRNYVCSMTPTDVRERPSLTTFSTPLSQLWCPGEFVGKSRNLLGLFLKCAMLIMGFSIPSFVACKLQVGWWPEITDCGSTQIKTIQCDGPVTCTCP